MILKSILRIIAYIWQLPQHLGALILWVFVRLFDKNYEVIHMDDGGILIISTS